MESARAEPAAPAGAQPPNIPAGKHRPAVILFITLTGLVLIADLAVKFFSFARVADTPVQFYGHGGSGEFIIPPHQPVIVVPGVLSLSLLVNHGAVFGMFQGQRWFFLLASIVAVGVIGRVFWVSRRNAHVLHVALALILAGALGNLYDRAIYGAVRDMLFLFPDTHLPWGWHWPRDERGLLYPWVFNVADVALVVGVMLMALLLWRSSGTDQLPAGDKTKSQKN